MCLPDGRDSIIFDGGMAAVALDLPIQRTPYSWLPRQGRVHGQRKPMWISQEDIYPPLKIHIESSQKERKL